MLRVLHLVENDPGPTEPMTLALVAESIQGSDTYTSKLLLLGGRTSITDAEKIGIHNADRLGLPGTIPLLGWAAARNWLGHQQSFDLVHCWSAGSLMLACVMLPQTPKIWTVARPPAVGVIKRLLWLTRRHRAGQVTALVTTEWAQQALARGGWNLVAIPLLEPAIDLARIHTRRDDIRHRWKVDAKTQVVALVSEPTSEADALRASVAANQTYEALKSRRGPEPRLRLLVHPRQYRRHAAQKTMEAFGSPAGIIQEGRLDSPWSVLPGCDAALALGGTSAGLQWAMASGVPVVAELTGALGALTDDGRTALLARPHDHLSIASQLLRLLHEPHMAAALAKRARIQIEQRSNPQLYRRDLAEHYARTISAQHEDALRLPRMTI